MTLEIQFIVPFFQLWGRPGRQINGIGEPAHPPQGMGGSLTPPFRRPLPKNSGFSAPAFRPHPSLEANDPVGLRKAGLDVAECAQLLCDTFAEMIFAARIDSHRIDGSAAE